MEKNCRYVVGDVASFMIDIVHHSNDDCEEIDSAINQIMKKYLG